LIESQPPEKRGAINQALIAAAQPFVTPQGVVKFDNQAILVGARV